MQWCREYLRHPVGENDVIAEPERRLGVDRARIKTAVITDDDTFAKVDPVRMP